jgi:hypothetical protein
MAKLAYCKTCKSTYPLAIVNPDSLRAGKEKRPLACPFGHSDVREVEEMPAGEPKKRKK